MHKAEPYATTLPPGDGVLRRVLALSRIGDPAGQLGTGVGDGSTQRLLAVLGLGLAAIALPAEYHADLDANAVALKGGGDDEEQENHHKGYGDPNRLRSEEHTSELQS